MAIVVLLSTMSFTLDMHYCGDTLVDIAVFKKAETCGMEMQKSISEDSQVQNSHEFLISYSVFLNVLQIGI